MGRPNGSNIGYTEKGVRNVIMSRRCVGGQMVEPAGGLSHHRLCPVKPGSSYSTGSSSVPSTGSFQPSTDIPTPEASPEVKFPENITLDNLRSTIQQYHETAIYGPP